MNISLSSIVKLCTFIFVITSLSVNAQLGAPAQQMPFQPGQGMPKLSDEDLKALEEVDKILSNMNPEEMDEFLKFVEEIEKGIESGEININDLLPARYANACTTSKTSTCSTCSCSRRPRR